MQMCSPDSKEPSRRLRQNNNRSYFSVSAEEGVESVLEISADRNVLLLRMNDYMVSRED